MCTTEILHMSMWNDPAYFRLQHYFCSVIQSSDLSMFNKYFQQLSAYWSLEGNFALDSIFALGLVHTAYQPSLCWDICSWKLPISLILFYCFWCHSRIHIHKYKFSWCFHRRKTILILFVLIVIYSKKKMCVLCVHM